MNCEQVSPSIVEEPVVIMENISKAYYKRPVLNSFNLSINRGEFVAIIGSSGSGKSTVLNIIGLLDTADSGRLSLFGKISPKISSKEARRYLREKIGYLFQNAALIDQDSTEANLSAAQRYTATPKRLRAKERENALSAVGLEGILKRKIYELSGGEQQRVALACLLVKPNELILADEPTGSLDPGNRDEVIRILYELKNQGKTIIMVTHDPIVAEKADRTISLD